MLKVVAFTLLLTGLLWFGVHRFVGGTDGLPDALDIRDVDAIDLEAMAARLEAERLALEANPPAAVQPSAEPDPEAPEHAEGDAELTVATVEDEEERADSDADMVERGGEARVEVEDRDEELARLLEETDRELLAGAPPTRAVDVGLPIAEVARCPAAAGARYRTGVLFRHGSTAIKGRSLTRLDELLALRRACGGGELRIAPNPEGETDGDAALAERRREEVKYYLLQRRVPAADIVYGERS